MPANEGPLGARGLAHVLLEGTQVLARPLEQQHLLALLVGAPAFGSECDSTLLVERHEAACVRAPQRVEVGGVDVLAHPRHHMSSLTPRR